MAGLVGSQSDLGTSPPAQASPQQGILAWLDLMGTCEQFLLAGLQRAVGPEGDLQAAYQRWYVQQMAEHDRMMVHILQRFAQGATPHAS